MLEPRPLIISKGTRENLPEVARLLLECDLHPDGLAESYSHLFLARKGGALLGCVALEVYGSAALLRSLAVQEGARGCGLGTRLMEACIRSARDAGLERLYLLTETAGGFFPRFGFAIIARAQVDPSVKNSLEFESLCPESALAMALELDPNGG